MLSVTVTVCNWWKPKPCRFALLISVLSFISHNFFFFFFGFSNSIQSAANSNERTVTRGQSCAFVCLQCAPIFKMRPPHCICKQTLQRQLLGVPTTTANANKFKLWIYLLSCKLCASRQSCVVFIHFYFYIFVCCFEKTVEEKKKRFISQFSHASKCACVHDISTRLANSETQPTHTHGIVQRSCNWHGRVLAVILIFFSVVNW